jgi:hypothetical protein
VGGLIRRQKVSAGQLWFRQWFLIQEDDMAIPSDEEFKAAQQRAVNTYSNYNILSQKRKPIRLMSKDERAQYDKERRRKIKSGEYVPRHRRSKEIKIADDTNKFVRELEQRIDKKYRRNENRVSKARPRQLRRAINRFKKIPQNRLCVYCNKKFYRSKQWVIKNEFVGCLKCWRNQKC